MATILMVDDDPLIGQLTKISLSRLGHEVLTATGGVACLELVRQVRPPLVILDLVLPDGEGLDILEQIRVIAPRTAVVIFTAWGSESIERKASRLGASAFLEKGRTPGLLRSTVARILETQAAVSPGSEPEG
jgi:DNA-binding NtrC family response regulator